jgi:membrane protein
LQRAWRYVKAFYVKAYEEDLTGMSAMVAYNLLLSLFPLACLALFIAGALLQSSELEESAIDDLQQIFPTAAESTLESLLARVRDQAATFGLVAVVGSIWFGSSFWGALDTAFCRIYHLECRSWLEQKRFALLMLVVVLLFMAATVTIPAAQTILSQGASELPLGLGGLEAVVFGLTLAFSFLLVFGILCLIFWAVPNRVVVPWRAIWPGAAGATVAMTIVDYAFPAYLGSIGTLAGFGTTVVFVLILLIWFYALALIILSGAIVNAMRFESHERGKVTASREESVPVETAI